MIDPGTRASSPEAATRLPFATEPRVLFISAASGLAEDREWIVDLQQRYDLVHWHDGIEGLGTDCARRLVEALATAEKPLVITMNEGDAGTGEHGAPAGPLDVLIAAAAAVIVGDEATADQIGDTWGRTAVVIADPEEDEAVSAVYRSVLAMLS